MNGTSAPELAALLRKSADVVERKEFHPLLFQTMRALTAYAGEYADGSIKSTAPPSAAASSAAASAVKEAPQQQPQPQKLRRRGSRDAPGSSEANKQDRGDPPGKKKSAFHDVPDTVLDSNGGNSQGAQRASGSSAASLSSYAAAAGAAPSGAAAAAARVSAPGGQFASAAVAASGSNNKQESSPQQQHQTPSRGKTGVFNQENSQQQQPTPSSSRKGVFSLKGIKKGIEKIGADILGDHDKNRDDVPFDEMAWCDEHFTRGCACKSRKNAANNNSSNDKQHSGVTASTSTDSVSAGQQQQQQQPASQAMRQSQTSSNTTSNAVTDPEKPAKPCFQRPINPSSNLIANGWIDQQRRSKMRVVWKDVLASLVEGRRPGEETTLWIQRQVINAQTGKVTGLEALHQIPMKWLEDVNYVDLYGDHRFTLKVYNIAEEFYFRTRDEQSAQSWVLTLRSARDASLEGNVRMLGSSTSSAQSAAMDKMKPSAKDMGLHNVDDWDQGKNNSHEGAAASSPPLAQAGSDGGADSHPSSSPSQPQQQPVQPAAAPVRKPISELRAVAHGAGYNTRGMERQDLERIAAHVQSGSYNPNPPASAPPAAASGSDNIRHSMQQEAAMREAEQRAAIEKREKEQAQAKAAQMAQDDAMARRQHENEERAAVEKMRRERDAAEKKRIEEQMAAAEHQRRNQEFEQQAVEIKRKQEEDRHRKMAELQAAERTRQQQHQAQAVAAAERNKREEEEQRRRHQQQAQQHHQQQQQAQRQGTIPSPPTSGQQQQQWGQPQQQQQQHYQQWQQHQQQQHAHFQQQGFPGQQQQHHPQQPFFNQNMPPQGAYQQQQHQQQQQHAHFQHQQQQKQQPQHPQPGANPQGANAANPDSKYAKQMEEKNDEEDQSAVTLQIKRSILINWALQPPNLNVLRPIDQLITSIHTAMPPAFGVATHAYFAKFTPIAPTELVVSAAMGNHPDETKLKKAVRKVRVFLHPDKLPRDLTTDQLFTARMLWDITSDSWEEFQKHKDELDWIRS